MKDGLDVKSKVVAFLKDIKPFIIYNNKLIMTISSNFPFNHQKKTRNQKIQN